MAAKPKADVIVTVKVSDAGELFATQPIEQAVAKARADATTRLSGIDGVEILSVQDVAITVDE